jgi:hypothetical protein
MNKTLKTVAVTAGLTVYEVLLIFFAADNFTLKRSWYTIIGSMPVTESTIEFVIFLGQLPVLIFLGWLWNKNRQKLESDLLARYPPKKK